MPDDVTDLDTPDGTPPEDVSPEVVETHSEPEPEADDAKGEGTDEPKEPQRDPAWDNLAKKFAHIEDPKEREDAIAKAYWEKTNYASRVRKENEQLKRQVARIESETKAKPPKSDPDEPPPPPQELEALDGQLKALYDEDQSLLKEANTHISELNKVSDEIAKCEARIEDAKEAQDEARVERHEARLLALQTQKDNIARGYKSVHRDRLRIARDYEKLGKDRLWLEQALKDRESRQAREQQELEDFKGEFPDEVDRLIETAATRHQIPESYIEELMEEVNDGLLVDLHKLGQADLDDCDVPSLVEKRVEKFAKVRNLAARRKFQETSREKLKVASVTRPAAGAGTTPAKPSKPATPASMTGGDLTPKMKRARDYLVSRGY